MTVVRGYKQAIAAALEIAEDFAVEGIKAYDGQGTYRTNAVTIYKHPTKRLYAVYGSGSTDGEALHYMNGGQ